MNWITVLGLAAATCTTISYLPQVIKIIKTKRVDDLSLGMYLILTAGVGMWLIYGILTGDIPITIANTISFLFTFTILILKIKYDKIL